MQAALVEVLLRNRQAAVEGRAFDERVFTVEHDMVVDVGSLVDPVAARLCVWTFDHQLVQHGVHYLRGGQRLLGRVCTVPTCGTRLVAVLLGIPGVLEADAAEVVLAGQADGLVKGRMADEADEVAVAGGDILQQVGVGGDFGNAALSTLRGW